MENILENNPPWVKEVACPFCKSIIVQFVDFDELFDDPDLSDYEKHEIAHGPLNSFNGYCSHVGYYNDGLNQPYVADAWQEEMLHVAGVMIKDGDCIFDDLSSTGDEARETADTPAEGSECLIAKVLPHCDFSIVNKLVAKHGGGQGTGEICFELIFLKKKHLNHS